MPLDDYKELTSRFWNLIYKEPYNLHKFDVGDDDNIIYKKMNSQDIIGIDEEFAFGNTSPFKFNFGNLSNFLGGPFTDA